MNKYLIGISCAIGLFSANPVVAASFDCSKASNPYEKAVCANPNLSSLDDQLAVVYKNARAKTADPEALKKAQIDWIKATRQCASDTSCIEKAYKDRIAVLSGGSQTQRPTLAATQSQPPAARNTVTQAPPQQAPTLAINMSELVCTDKEMYVEKPNGEQIQLGVGGSKPFKLIVKNNVISSFYSPQKLTFIDGARYDQSISFTTNRGEELRGYKFIKKDPDGSVTTVSIYQASPIRLLMVTSGGGVPNTSVGIAHCN
jgi:uncharacterized protein